MTHSNSDRNFTSSPPKNDRLKTTNHKNSDRHLQSINTPKIG
ncbi:hypothetical protein [Crocosphaera sp. XPORK-15E]|nr:hypothetical protein [Crocosphaera sp. XPORK-15E]MEA5534668.1 hypothetical protein [Crocosphaera sp. XPORK-15E]